MKAKEARKLASLEENLDGVLKKIRTAARRGDYSCSILSRRLNDVEIERLKDLGYKVTFHIGEYLISWKS